MSKAPQRPASAGKTLSYRALFWRCWIVASLGWLLLTGVDMAATAVKHQDLSAEAMRLVSARNGALRGSSRDSDATTRLRRIAYEKEEAQNHMIRGGMLMVAAPLGLLFLGYIASLFLQREDA